MQKPSRLILLLSLASALSACGGGSSTGSSSKTDTAAGVDTSTNDPNLVLIGGIRTVGVNPVADPPADNGSTMSCVDGSTVQCSGNTILRTDNHVAMTRSGVQAYGKSTNDLAPVNVNTGQAIGMTPASGGIAEIRVTKSANSTPSAPALMLRNLGISWDSVTDRPPIIETFQTTQGRVALDANGKILHGPLPDASNIDFYDYARKGRSATQSRYANNAYFPRDLTPYPVRCMANAPNCPTIETDGYSVNPGNWRTGGTEPDSSTVRRLHEDGDLYAGDDLPGPNGERRYLPDGDGFGTSFPGFKGWRSMDLWTMQYANLANWYTMDTVNIIEFAGGGNEHNKGRRGIVAFGQVTDPATVPASGTETYSGVAYGSYVPNGTDESVFYRGAVTIVVNFATGQAQVSIANTATYNAAATPVPSNFSTTMNWTAGTLANYMTGAVAASGSTLPGGVSARFFGPVSADAPPEIAGAFTLNNAGTGQTSIGGFIVRKR